MAKSPTIPEAKIRQAIWMLKKGKTKKAVCDHVGMAYSPKRLDTLIEDFHKRIEREKQLKAKARFKKFSESEKKSMADDYLKGDGLSAIAQRNFISPQRVKKFLMELNVPLRSRGKKKAAKVEHVVQDLDIKFKYHLDRYKYYTRYIAENDIKTPEYHREECLKILFEIETLLESNSLWLFDNKPSYLDIAILPFVRQYRIADMNWFDNEMPLSNIKEWLNRFLVWNTFEKIMIKNPLWEDSQTKIYFGQD